MGIESYQNQNYTVIILVGFEPKTESLNPYAVFSTPFLSLSQEVKRRVEEQNDKLNPKLNLLASLINSPHV